MKLKIMTSLIAAALCTALCSCGSGDSSSETVSEPDTNAKTYTEADAQAYFDSVTSSEEYETITPAERQERLNLPEDMLPGLSTDDLIDVVLFDYPYNVNMLAADPLMCGYGMLDFNGAAELSQRSDAPELLIERYRNEPVNSASDGIPPIKFYEITLISNFVQKSLTDEQYSDLIETAKSKEADMQASDPAARSEILEYDEMKPMLMEQMPELFE